LLQDCGEIATVERWPCDLITFPVYFRRCNTLRLFLPWPVAVAVAVEIWTDGRRNTTVLFVEILLIEKIFLKKLLKSILYLCFNFSLF
jgi:hypothetical protein